MHAKVDPGEAQVNQNVLLNEQEKRELMAAGGNEKEKFVLERTQAIMLKRWRPPTRRSGHARAPCKELRRRDGIIPGAQAIRRTDRRKFFEENVQPPGASGARIQRYAVDRSENGFPNAPDRAASGGTRTGSERLVGR